MQQQLRTTQSVVVAALAVVAHAARYARGVDAALADTQASSGQPTDHSVPPPPRSCAVVHGAGPGWTNDLPG